MNPQIAFATQIGPREVPIPPNILMAAILGLRALPWIPGANSTNSIGAGNSGVAGDVTNSGIGAQGVA
jgi:hypothetical protein